MARRVNPRLQRNFTGLDGFVWAVGVVEDRIDPLKLGRCKVRYLGWHPEDKLEWPTEKLPWSYPLLPLDSGRNTIGPKEGDWVAGFFRDGIVAQEPVMLGILPGIPEKIADPSKGFNDPRPDSVLVSGVVPRDPFTSPVQHDDGSGSVITELGKLSRYPQNEYGDGKLQYVNGKEPITNRMERNEKIDATVVKTKKDNVKIGQKNTPSDSDTPNPSPHNNSGVGSDSQSLITHFTEADTPYGAKYPYNHAYWSESGHLIEVDDTPGAERLHWYHRSGTFKEIHPTGLQVEKVVDEQFHICLKSRHTHIEASDIEIVDHKKQIVVNKNSLPGENLDITVGANGNFDVTLQKGNLNTFMMNGNRNTKIAVGSDSYNVDLDEVGVIQKNRSVTVGSDDTLNVFGNATIIVHKNATVNVMQNLTANVGQKALVTTGSDMDIHVGGNLRFNVNGNIFEQCMNKTQMVLMNYNRIVGMNTNVSTGMNRNARALTTTETSTLVHKRSALTIIDGAGGTATYTCLANIIEHKAHDLLHLNISSPLAISPITLKPPAIHLESLGNVFTNAYKETTIKSWGTILQDSRDSLVNIRGKLNVFLNDVIPLVSAENPVQISPVIPPFPHFEIPSFDQIATALNNAAKTVVSNLISTAQNMIVSEIDGLIMMVQTDIANVVATLSSVQSTVQGLISQASGLVNAASTANFSSIMSGLAGAAVNAGQSFAASAMNQVAANVQGAIQTQINSATGAVQGALQGQLNQVTSTIGGYTSQIPSFATSASDVMAQGIAAGNAVATNISNNINQIADQVNKSLNQNVNSKE